MKGESIDAEPERCAAPRAGAPRRVSDAVARAGRCDCLADRRWPLFMSQPAPRGGPSRRTALRRSYSGSMSWTKDQPP